MKKLITALAIIGICAIIIALCIPTWAGDKEYQDCLKLQQQGYAIHCIPPDGQGLVFTEGIPKKQIEEKKSVLYEVRLTITYNAVNRLRITQIASQALARHEEACQVEVKIKKNGDIPSSGHIYITGSGSIMGRQ